MNKTDRLLAIVLELQRNKVLRAEDLAAKFETSVRTIYRDIQALSEAGVSVVGAPGQGYSIMEGYFLPPVSFTVEEAVTLLIGTDFIEQWFDAYYGSKSRHSREKIEAILPESIRSEAARIRGSFRLLATAEEAVRVQEKAYLNVIRQAILEKRKISFRYSKSITEMDGNCQNIRTAAPYGLVLVRGSWVLIAWCELRQGIRHFRLSRMTELTVQEMEFMLPDDFRLAAYKPPDDRNVHVQVWVDSSIADKVKEAYNFYTETVEEHNGGLLITFRVRQPEELLQWVLGWGSGVVVLEPESFRTRVREELEKVLNRY
ncbi:helix-turn-helix transcriptional regulator [Paenibacillus tarimensis]|uniref:helix-turn-helix transcriptional regulator n=1 Tax=Paenibacillus tarimensis TaxID=416012 RepID=UPI001F1F7547|nr:YafY family protein [Paenibacillus tarimensis]MCF2944433.1 YafY family transcriptional regulator [Paenibacillus tarimensis]